MRCCSSNLWVVSVTLEEAYVTKGSICDLYATVSTSMLGLTNVEAATSGAVDTVDQVDGCADEPLSNMEGLFWVLNGGEEGGLCRDHSLSDVLIHSSFTPNISPQHLLLHSQKVQHLPVYFLPLQYPKVQIHLL
eukprot:g29419.t1